MLNAYARARNWGPLLSGWGSRRLIDRSLDRVYGGGGRVTEFLPSPPLSFKFDLTNSDFWPQGHGRLFWVTLVGYVDIQTYGYDILNLFYNYKVACRAMLRTPIFRHFPYGNGCYWPNWSALKPWDFNKVINNHSHTEIRPKIGVRNIARHATL